MHRSCQPCKHYSNVIEFLVPVTHTCGRFASRVPSFDASFNICTCHEGSAYGPALYEDRDPSAEHVKLQVFWLERVFLNPCQF